MKDIGTHLEKLRIQMAECEMIRDLATDRNKRELFVRLAEHFGALAAELENAAHDAVAATSPGTRSGAPLQGKATD